MKSPSYYTVAFCEEDNPLNYVKYIQIYRCKHEYIQHRDSTPNTNICKLYKHTNEDLQVDMHYHIIMMVILMHKIQCIAKQFIWIYICALIEMVIASASYLGSIFS